MIVSHHFELMYIIFIDLRATPSIARSPKELRTARLINLITATQQKLLSVELHEPKSGHFNRLSL